ncbi:MAG: hypothetical protein NTZ02_04810 [Candidatus Woesearchaeota archaeon]|nr:hypothetical protein [Candidatus Woesearchaeota archaeon]
MASAEKKQDRSKIEDAMLAFIRELCTDNPEKIFHERIERALAHGRNSEVVLLGEDVFLSESCSEELKKKIELQKVVYCGVKRGTIKDGIFIPGPNFLNDIVPFLDELNYVIVNERAEWLFLCGRDIFKEGIVRKSLSRGNALVLNERMECLGYGKTETKGSQVIKNIFDLGDFLRRERKRE